MSTDAQIAITPTDRTQRASKLPFSGSFENNTKLAERVRLLPSRRGLASFERALVEGKIDAIAVESHAFSFKQ